MKLKISLIIFLFLIIRIHNCKSQDTISIFYIPDKGSYNSYYDFINDKQDSIYNSCNSDSINRIYISIRNGPYQDTVEWRLSGSNNLVQKGFFDKSGLASGKFEQFINLNYTSTCEYKNGKKNGILKIKFNSSIYIANYIDGLKDGVEYKIDGEKLLRISNYSKGKKNGFSTSFDTNGISISEMYYIDGIQRDGIYKRYYPNKKIWYILECIDGKCNIIEPKGLILEIY